VIARDYQSALDESFEEKHDTREPIEVEIIDPDLGKALRILARGAGKAVALGAKYTYVAGKTVAKEAAFAIARAYRSKTETLNRRILLSRQSDKSNGKS